MATWTDSDNLNGAEALVVGGPSDGLRVTVHVRGSVEVGEYRYPDVLDLTDYEFDPTTWTFEYQLAEIEPGIYRREREES